MGLAYGTVLDGTNFAEAEEEWRAGRHLATKPEVGILFRVEAVSYSYVVDADREEYGSTAPRLELSGHEVLRWTPCGATLKYLRSGCRPKWVNLQPGTKQWASRTAREAVEQFRLRRKGQVHILRRQLARAEFERDLAEGVLAVADLSADVLKTAFLASAFGDPR